MNAIPKIPLITARPIILYSCEECGNIFSEPVIVHEFEPTPSPGFPSGSMRRELGSPCHGCAYDELGEEE
jgi:predicted nucleic acid-binding Zn ribbon protein